MILYLFGGHVMWLCTVEHLVTNMSCLIIMFSFHPWIIGFDFCLFIQTMIVFLASMSYSLNIVPDSLLNFPNHWTIGHFEQHLLHNPLGPRFWFWLCLVSISWFSNLFVHRLMFEGFSISSLVFYYKTSTWTWHRGNGLPLFHLPRITRPITVKTGLLSLALSMEVT